MPDLTKNHADDAIRARVHQALKERPGFHVEYELPDFFKEKLETLDRVVTDVSAPKP